MKNEAPNANLQQIIARKFLAILAKGDAVDAAKIEQLRQLLEKRTKVKPDDLVTIFTASFEDGDAT